MIVQDAGNLRLLPPRERGDANPHVVVMWEMLTMCANGGGGGALLVCHVDISDCFWSIVLPEQFRTCFHILIDAIVRVLVTEGAIVNPNSKLTPPSDIDWIGKTFHFGRGSLNACGRSGQHFWHAGWYFSWVIVSTGTYCAWWAPYCGNPSLCGDTAFLASTWAHVLWAPQRLNYTPLRLLHALIPSPVSIHSHHEGAVDDTMSITVAQDICRAKRS